MEAIGVAERAQAGDADMIGAHSSSEELAAIGFHQVDMGALVQIAAFREQLRELRGDIGAYFIAAGADGRSDGGL